MFVIFGIDQKNSERINCRFKTRCYHCNNTTNWILEKRIPMVSLFFIPLIPIKNEYYYLCPICNHGEKISREEYEEKKRR